MPCVVGGAACVPKPFGAPAKVLPVDRGFWGNPDLNCCSVLPSMQSVFGENKQPGPDAFVKPFHSF